jgi:predicted PurR-regulated permease PerM
VVKKEETKDTARTAAKAAVEASWPQTRVILRVIIIVLAVALTLWVIVKLTEVILLLILSVFFAYLVSPLVEFLRRPITIRGREWAMPRIVAISLAYLIIIGGIVIAIYVLVPRLSYQFPEFAQQARGYWTTVSAKAQTLNEYLTRRVPGPLMESINKETPNILHNIGSAVTAIGQQLVSRAFYLTWLILIPILSFFFLKDAEMFRRSALQMLPRGRWRWRGDEFFQDINSTLAAYVRAQLSACLFIGVVCSLGFALLGLPSPLVLGFIAGVFEFVPLIGPLLIAILAAIVAILHSGPFSALMVLLFLGVLRVVQDYFIYPRLIGHGIQLHPLAVILAILAGAELGGVTGVFLAIPAVAILTVSYRHWLEHRGSEGLADVLEPSPTVEPESPTDWLEPAEPVAAHPNVDTTPDEMVRARPDLTTGELKMPVDN